MHILNLKICSLGTEFKAYFFRLGLIILSGKSSFFSSQGGILLIKVVHNNLKCSYSVGGKVVLIKSKMDNVYIQLTR